MEANEAVRERLLALVRERPGCSTRKLAAEVGLSESGAAYHLHKIARSGDVRSHLNGRDRCWYAAICGLCPVLRRAIPVLTRPPVAKVARALHATPLSAADLADATGLARGTARWAAMTLSRTLLTERSRGGRTSLRDGAEICLAKALSGETCSLWGECEMSAAWHERLVANEGQIEPRKRTSSG